MLVSIITIGDELLIGQTIDTNAAWIGQQLSQLGCTIKSKYTCSDVATDIINTLQQATLQADLIIITGGLGPTKDDITKHTLAQFFNQNLIIHTPTLDRLTAYFEASKRSFSASLKSIALQPDASIVLANTQGLAPGILIENDSKRYVCLPGVPAEMKAIFTESFLPVFQPTLTVESAYVTLMTAGVGESVLADKIKHIEETMPEHVTIAYLPDYGIVRLRITATGATAAADATHYANSIKAVVGSCCYADIQIELAAFIGQLLTQKKLTLGIAESCSGGYVSHLITSQPNCSFYFNGAIVCYSNAQKMKHLGVAHKTLETHGAVSEATVSEMLNGALQALDCNVAIAISGIAGPGGGSIEKPVGTIVIGVGTSERQCIKVLSLARDRKRNIQWSSMLLLNELRLFVTEYL